MKTALVTGASRGIGAAIARRLEKDGIRTIRRSSEQADLSTMEGVDKALEDIDNLDILVNNAAAQPAGPIESDTPESFDRLMAVNVKAPYFLIQRAPLNDGGRIVNVSSVATRMANPAQTSFAMTKGALETMSRTLAHQLGPRGITVNVVAPGATRTADNGAIFTSELEAAIKTLTAHRRLGTAEDIADVVAFLASDDARWVTGQVIEASGGLFLGPPGQGAE
ncbi:SDR family oxidoreductase [Amycolatopsis roodepoortensis]|uniref:SDR family oxidoreductase n=1 Tax=Amycolatopsis roodepoortensis TaxID=700274 RepID=UPI00214CF1BF|nr:SDR family oxidoreductase [Amycolatopsis roodepoortensis]UUV28483.1 SDR family oxidoreductase [Amycolatopsis roodepoortensis]